MTRIRACCAVLFICSGSPVLAELTATLPKIGFEFEFGSYLVVRYPNTNNSAGKVTEQSKFIDITEKAENQAFKLARSKGGVPDDNWPLLQITADNVNVRATMELTVYSTLGREPQFVISGQQAKVIYSVIEIVIGT